MDSQSFYSVLYTCIPVPSALKGTLKGRSIYFAGNRCSTGNNSLPFYDQPYPDLFLLGNSTRLTLSQVGRLVHLESFSAALTHISVAGGIVPECH